VTRSELDLYEALNLDARSRHRISLRVTAGRHFDPRPLLALAAAVALLIAGVGLSWGTERVAVPPPSSSEGAAVAASPVSRQVIVPTIAYVVSPDVAADNAPVYLRVPGTGGDTHVADGLVVRGVAPDVLLVVRKDGRALGLRVGERATLFSDRALRGAHTESLVVGNTFYEWSADELVAIDQRGAIQSLSLPAAVATTEMPCEGEKGRFDPRASSLRAIASVRGSLFAYVATLGNGAVVSMNDGRRLDLLDAGSALAMIEGTDGKLYVLTFDGRCSSNQIMLRRINPTTMVQETVIDLGHGLPVERIGLVNAAGSTYVHEVTATGAQLLLVGSTSVTAIPLAPDSGLFEAAAPDGTIYFFGGRARGVVTRFDPGSRATMTVDAARAPEGARVVAVFFVR
jgi:hypothetical protein